MPSTAPSSADEKEFNFSVNIFSALKIHILKKKIFITLKKLVETDKLISDASRQKIEMKREKDKKIL